MWAAVVRWGHRHGSVRQPSTTESPPITSRFGSMACMWIPRTSRGAGEEHRRRCTSRSLPQAHDPILPSVHGLLGGTFDPPHIGHLAVAHAALEQLDVGVVQFVPAGDPWQKRHEYVSEARHRLAMTRLAAAEDDRFAVDDREVRREGPSYTVTTVEEFGPGCVLILGADAALNIPTWHRASDLMALANIAVVPRPGVDADSVRSALGRDVVNLSMPTIDLSGTQIRAHVKAGYSARFLVPDAVNDYIHGNGLYR